MKGTQVNHYTADFDLCDPRLAFRFPGHALELGSDAAGASFNCKLKIAAFWKVDRPEERSCLFVVRASSVLFPVKGA
jgi:hypothetical protein